LALVFVLALKEVDEIVFADLGALVASAGSGDERAAQAEEGDRASAPERR